MTVFPPNNNSKNCPEMNKYQPQNNERSVALVQLFIVFKTTKLYREELYVRKYKHIGFI